MTSVVNVARAMQKQATYNRGLWVCAGVKCVKVLCFLVVAYVVVYVVLSMNGSYEPDAFSLRGVIDYEWAPFGFYAKPVPKRSAATRDVDFGDWNRVMLRIFFPLWYIDIRLFHTISLDGRSPA